MSRLGHGSPNDSAKQSAARRITTGLYGSEREEWFAAIRRRFPDEIGVDIDRSTIVSTGESLAAYARRWAIEHGKDPDALVANLRHLMMEP